MLICNKNCKLVLVFLLLIIEQLIFLDADTNTFKHRDVKHWLDVLVL